MPNRHEGFQENSFNTHKIEKNVLKSAQLFITLPSEPFNKNTLIKPILPNTKYSEISYPTTRREINLTNPFMPSETKNNLFIKPIVKTEIPKENLRSVNRIPESYLISKNTEFKTKLDDMMIKKKPDITNSLNKIETRRSKINGFGKDIFAYEANPNPPDSENMPGVQDRMSAWKDRLTLSSMFPEDIGLLEGAQKASLILFLTQFLQYMNDKKGLPDIEHGSVSPQDITLMTVQQFIERHPIVSDAPDSRNEPSISERFRELEQQQNPPDIELRKDVQARLEEFRKNAAPAFPSNSEDLSHVQEKLNYLKETGIDSLLD